jgi:hypothetical protein
MVLPETDQARQLFKALLFIKKSIALDTISQLLQLLFTERVQIHVLRVLRQQLRCTDLVHCLLQRALLCRRHGVTQCAVYMFQHVNQLHVLA